MRVLIKTFHLFTYLFERLREREVEADLPSAGLVPKCLQLPGLGQDEVRSRGHSLGLLRRWRGPKYLSHYLTPLKLCLSKNWSWSLILDSNPGTLTWAVDFLTARPNACLYQGASERSRKTDYKMSLCWCKVILKSICNFFISFFKTPCIHGFQRLFA